MSKKDEVNGAANRTARDATKEAQLRARRANRGNQEQADWSAVDASKFLTAVANVTRHGYALMVGYTSEQGAYVVRIVGLDDIKPDYIRPSEDIDLYLEGLALDFE